METKNTKQISNRTYKVFAGLFLCLLNASLCINTGFVAKALSFPFLYAFGMASYVIYLFMFIQGCALMFAGKWIKFKLNRIFWGILIAVIGLISLLSYFFYGDTSYLTFANSGEGKNIFDLLKTSFSGYFVKEQINVFVPANRFNFGLVGYSIVGIGSGLIKSTAAGIIAPIIFLLIGLFLAIVPTIIYAVEERRTDAEGVERRKAERAAKREEKYLALEEKKSSSNNIHKRIKNIDPVRGAKKVDPETYHSEVSGAGKNVEDYDNENIPLTNGTSNGNNNEIKDVFLFDESFGNVNQSNSNQPKKEEFKEAILDLDDAAPRKDTPVVAESKSFDSITSLNESFNQQSIQQNSQVIEEKQTNPIDAYTPEKDNSISAFNQQPLNPTPVAPQVAPVVQPVIQQPVQPSIQPQPPVEAEQPKKKERVNFKVMNSEGLNCYESTETQELNARVASERKEIINNTFADFNIGAYVCDYTIGPSITRFNIQYKSNVSSRSVSNMVQDISIRLNGVSARFESVIEGQSTSGLEIPNAKITMVSFKDVYDALPDPKKHPLAIAFGKNIKGSVICADYDEFPHMLISGTTGSGKSVFVNSIICSLIMRNSPDDLKLVLVDPKKVEMSRYADMPHLLTPIITEPSKVKVCLDKLVDEMEYRYSLFSKNGATNIKEYNEDCEFNGNERIPYIVVILDEYADLVEQCREISLPVVMLAQKARACGIHLMVATQRPSTNVVTGVIKANMPTHVALMTASSVDSITIIGEGGAEKLLGKGDMLVQSPLVSRVGVCRLQSCYIDRKEIVKIIADLKSKYPTNYDPTYLNLEEQKPAAESSGPAPDVGGESDEETKYKSIRDWVMTQEYMSMSKIQRDCGVGFNRAGRFFNRLQKEGVIASEPEGSKGCKVITQNKFGEIDDDDVIATSEDNSYLK